MWEVALAVWEVEVVLWEVAFAVWEVEIVVSVVAVEREIVRDHS